VLLIVVMSLGRTQLGLRYILPAYPMAMLWAGRTFPSLCALGRWAPMAGALALAVAMAGARRVHPHYLMFFNSWIGGPDNGPQYLVIGDSSGQDQKRLADWQAAQGLSSIYYTRYSGRPEYWGIAYSAPPCRPQSGVYALEAIEVHRPRRIEAGCLDGSPSSRRTRGSAIRSTSIAWIENGRRGCGEVKEPGAILESKRNRSTRITDRGWGQVGLSSERMLRLVTGGNRVSCAIDRHNGQRSAQQGLLHIPLKEPQPATSVSHPGQQVEVPVSVPIARVHARNHLPCPGLQDHDALGRGIEARPFPRRPRGRVAEEATVQLELAADEVLLAVAVPVHEVAEVGAQEVDLGGVGAGLDPLRGPQLGAALVPKFL
jgi:hypothetical protein